MLRKVKLSHSVEKWSAVPMEPHVIMLGAGGILLAGLLADTIGRRLGLPRVTLLVLIGVAAGPDGRALIPSAMRAATNLVAALALTMVVFLLGSELSRKTLSQASLPSPLPKRNPYGCKWPQLRRAQAASEGFSGTCLVPSTTTRIPMCAKAR